jgi:tRNA/rRNA methyltransferase/tRNA (cytidine32/uridine32-2'-O)-methyltransferase
MTDTLLDAVRVVLYEPQNHINIAAVVRAMKNMGVRSLRLVRPVEYDPFRLEGIAHDTNDIIERIEHFDTIEAALADCVRVAGFTARRRAAKRKVLAPREAASELLGFGQEGPVALLFGREDAGLPNDALDHAHVVITIPTTDHASLNLAQAALVALYELHLAANDATRALRPPRKDAPASRHEEYELFFKDAERALRSIEFFKTRFPEHIMRSLRSLTFRSAPDSREISFMRAVAIEVVRYLDRTGRPISNGGRNARPMDEANEAAAEDGRET